MSQTPLSPVGKRMRTSLDLNSSNASSKSNGEPSSSQDSQRSRRLSHRSESNRSNSSDNRASSDNQPNYECQATGSGNDQRTESATVPSLEVEVYSESNSDTDELSYTDDSDDSSDVDDLEFEYEFDSGSSIISTYSLNEQLVIGPSNFQNASNYIDIENTALEDYIQYDPTPKSKYPKPDWLSLQELTRRRLGLPSKDRNSSRSRGQWNPHWFQKYANYSLWSIRKLELNQTLENHTGCVNCIDFDSNGRSLCSAGDDLNICVWDWQTNTLKKKLNSGHTRNIFHSQFCQSDQSVITGSRDGHVKLIDIESGHSRDLLKQSGEIGRLAFISSQTVVSCSTTGNVHIVDFRQEPTSRKLLTVRSPRNQRRCSLNTVTSHPMNRLKIAIGGDTPYVFLYDLRRVTAYMEDFENKPMYCVDNTTNPSNVITDVAFNSTGQNLLISYNDGDLVVCHGDTCDVVHRYKGHRNKKTIKNCAWFGDNYVLSGSDDGHIYGWDFQSEHIVCFRDADQIGIVNTLTVHPNLPVLASSGLDPNVKIWEPTAEWPHMMKGIKAHICRNSMRRRRVEEIQNAQNNLRAPEVDAYDLSDESEGSEIRSEYSHL